MVSRGSGGNAEERDPSRQCTAQTKNDTHCKRWAVPGMTVCPTHAKEMGIRLDQTPTRKEQKITNKLNHLVDTLRTSDVDVVVEDPYVELQKLMGEAVTLKEIMKERVLSIKQEDWTYFDRAGIEQARADIMLYERAIDRLGDLLQNVARLDLDDRLARIDQRRGEIVVSVLSRVLDRLDLSGRSDEVYEVFWEEVTRSQRMIPGGS